MRFKTNPNLPPRARQADPASVAALLGDAAAEAARLGKPLFIDLFGCQGGAAEGYSRAGFHVVSNDIGPQPRNPHPMIEADALWLLDTFGDWIAANAAATHASPPCQRKTKAQKIQGREHPALIAPTRQRLLRIGLPYVIENVVPDGPDDDPLIDPVVLCGLMFGMKTYRDREFESGNGFVLTAPEHPVHTLPLTKMGRPRRPGTMAHYVGNFSGVKEAREDMGMHWADRDGLREAIPVKYAEYVGVQLMAHVRSRVPA